MPPMVRPATHSETLFQLIAFIFALGRHDKQKQIHRSILIRKHSSLRCGRISSLTQGPGRQQMPTTGVRSIFPQAKPLVQRHLELALGSIHFRGVSCGFRSHFGVMSCLSTRLKALGRNVPPLSLSASVSLSAKGAYPLGVMIRIETHIRTETIEPPTQCIRCYVQSGCLRLKAHGPLQYGIHPVA